MLRCAALTLFTMYSKMDFSFLGMVLPVLLFTFIIWGFFAMFAFPSFAFTQVYALFGTIIFSLYVIYDTWSITTCAPPHPPHATFAFRKAS